MQEEFSLDGIDVIYRKKINGYVAVFGPEYVVHFTSPTGLTWIARRPFALEPICCHKNINECIRLAKRHYDVLAKEAKIRARYRLLQA